MRAFERYTLQATDLQSKSVQLDGGTLALGDNDALPDIAAIPTRPGVATFGITTLTFLAEPRAANLARH